MAAKLWNVADYSKVWSPLLWLQWQFKELQQKENKLCLPLRFIFATEQSYAGYFGIKNHKRNMIFLGSDLKMVVQVCNFTVMVWMAAVWCRWCLFRTVDIQTDSVMMTFLGGSCTNNLCCYVFQHPISRWIARYLLDPPEKNYEKDMALLDLEVKKSEMRYVL